MNASMLSVHGLDLSIGRQTVCRGLEFDLASGASLAILGRNGAGKSTLLAALAGLGPAATGSIRLQGKALPAHTPRELARLRAWCPQQQHDAFAATVLETALLGRHPHLDRWAWEDEADHSMAVQALARVGLADLAAREVHTLSGGERQRLALAVALVQAPRLYMLDEPLNHLDLNHAMLALGLLKQEVAKGGSVIAVLHDPNLALRHFDRTLLLFGDGSWQHGDSSEIINAETLLRLYGHPLRALHDNGAGGGQPWFIPE